MQCRRRDFNCSFGIFEMNYFLNILITSIINLQPEFEDNMINLVIDNEDINYIRGQSQRISTNLLPII